MYVIKSIIPFSMLVDTDMGLIKYIQFTCQGDNKYYPGIMNMTGPEYTETLQYTLIHRHFFNPLSAIVKSEKMLTCRPDDMLKLFFSNDYEEILKLSTPTALMDVVCKSLFVSDTLQFNIICDSELEKKELIRRFEKHFNTTKFPAKITVTKKNLIDTENYGNIYVKDVNELLQYKQPLEGKNILIGNYDFNKEFNTEDDEYMNLPIMDVVQKYMSNNKISFIDIYPMSIEKSSVG